MACIECKIPLDVVEAMIMMCERINEDVLSIATNEDIKNTNTLISLKHANEVVLTALSHEVKRVKPRE